MTSGSTELEAHLADLVLEEGAQRLDELELEVVGQPADVVVTLDVGCALAPAGLDDVGIERALHEPLDRVVLVATVMHDVARRLLEDADELLADRLALGLRIGDAGQRGEEALPGVDDDEVDTGRVDEVLLDLLGLPLAQQPVVDEDAGELVADGLLHQGRCDGGVDAAGERTEDPVLADLLTDRRDEVVDDVGRGPVGAIRRPSRGSS